MTEEQVAQLLTSIDGIKIQFIGLVVALVAAICCWPRTGHRRK